MILQGNAVLIKPDKSPERSEKGILIPETNVDNTSTGLIVTVGPECDVVKAGMKCIFNRKAASVMVFEGEDYFLTNEIASKIFYVELP